MGKIKKTVKAYLDDKIGTAAPVYGRLPKEADHVSFDIFDTLIVRDLNKPADLFEILEKQLDIPGFAEKRIAAERTARSRTENGEVDIYDIYRCFPGISRETAGLMIQAELEAEINVCHARPDMISFYKKCLKNKKVILVSDMYLTSDMMKKILDKCGITGYDRLYISCEAGKSKRSGGLYRQIISDLDISAERIVHIGNDMMSDTVKAKKEGVGCRKLRTKVSRLLAGDAPRRLAESRKEFSPVYNFINNTTCSNKRFKNFYYRFGYENLGILLMGFCKWLVEEAESQGIEQVLFIARDGFIIKKVYDMLGFGERIRSCYFEVSRRSIRVPVSFSIPQSYEDALRLMNFPSRIGAGQILEYLGLTAKDHAELLKKLGIDEKEMFWCKDLGQNQKVRMLYEALRGEIIHNASEEKAVLLEYLDSFGFDKKTAVVDIGYGATIQKELLKVLAANGIDADITGYYMFLDRKAGDNTEGIDFKAYGYIWDNYNRNDTVYEEQPFVGLFETLFFEQNGSVKRYIRTDNNPAAERYEYEYLMPGGERDEIGCIREVQNGALALVGQISRSRLEGTEPLNGKDAFFLMRCCMMRPSGNVLRHFANFRFFNAGSWSFLAKPKYSIFGYMLRPRQLKRDFYATEWKIGFFKYLLKIDMSYEMLWKILKIFFPSPKK